MVELVNAEEMAAAHPNTFKILSEGERRNLIVGNLAKVTFRVDKRDQAWGSAERMWVLVTEILGEGRYAGKLDSYPVLETNVKHGDRVEFEAMHIFDVVGGVDSV